MKPERLFHTQHWWVGCKVKMEGALGQRDKHKPVKGRQQAELGSKPVGWGDGHVCKAAWETSKCKVTRTCTIKKHCTKT